MVGLITAGIAKKLITKMATSFTQLNPTQDILKVYNMAMRMKGKASLSSIKGQVKKDLSNYAQQQGVSVQEMFELIKSVNTSSRNVRYYGENNNFKEFMSRQTGKRLNSVSEVYRPQRGGERDFSRAIEAVVVRIRDFYYAYYTPMWSVTRGVKGSQFPKTAMNWLLQLFEDRITPIDSRQNTLQTLNNIIAYEQTLETRLAPEAQSGDRVYFNVEEQDFRMLSMDELQSYMSSVVDIINTILEGGLGI